MKRLVFISTVFLSLTVFGQNDFNRWQVGATFSPDFAYRTNKDVNFSHEIGKFGYTTGLNIVYNFSKLFGLETGISFSDKGYQSKEVLVDIFDLYGTFVAENTKTKYITSYRYIDIPVKANFTFGKNRLYYVGTIGISANILINQKTMWFNSYVGNGTEIERDKDLKKINLSPMIGFGIDYKIYKNLNIRAIPTFRYGVIKPRDFLYLWNAGLELGVFYGF